MTEKIEKSKEEWKKQLTPDQYEICINHGTEPPFSGKYNDTKLEGNFKCTCCGEEIFSSDAKFDSGSGWPSFWKPISEDKIEYISDTTYGMVRTEVNCNKIVSIALKLAKAGYGRPDEILKKHALCLLSSIP